MRSCCARAPTASAQPHAATPSVPAGDALRSGSFWLLSAAFFLASVAGLAMMVHSIPFLIERGHSAAFAAFAVGLVGVSQIPGRLLFAPLAARLPRRPRPPRCSCSSLPGSRCSSASTRRGP